MTHYSNFSNKLHYIYAIYTIKYNKSMRYFYEITHTVVSINPHIIRVIIDA